MSHKIAHVSDSPLNAKTSRPDAVVWGPIDGPTAERLGLSSEVESRLIQPAAPEVARAAEAVLKLVPKNVLPVEGDTAESLVARLESSDWLDGMEVKEGGHGKGGRYVLLNSEEYPQPRRKSWSVLVKEEMEDEDGDHVHWLLAYKVPAKKSSWHCTVTAQHPAPRAAHRHTSPLRLRGGGARKIRETVGGTRCAPHTKGLLGYFIGRTLKQEQVYVDVVKEVAPGHPALSPLGEILPFCRELPGADYLSEDPHEETQHTLSVEQWLAYVSGQRTGVRLLVRAMFHKQLEAFDADAERQITLLVVPFQKRWGLWDYYEHCGGTRMRDIDSEQFKQKKYYILSHQRIFEVFASTAGLRTDDFCAKIFRVFDCF